MAILEEKHEMVAFQISASLILHPPTVLASELRWPATPKPRYLIHLLFVVLLKDLD